MVGKFNAVNVQDKASEERREGGRKGGMGPEKERERNGGREVEGRREGKRKLNK